MHAELLAASILARRATCGHPLTGKVKLGYARAAIAHGYGVAINGRVYYRSAHQGLATYGGTKWSGDVESMAGWICFCAENLDHGGG